MADESSKPGKPTLSRDAIAKPGACPTLRPLEDKTYVPFFHLSTTLR